MDPVYLDFRFNLPITVFFEVEVPKGPTPAQGLFKCRCIADQLTPAQPMSTTRNRASKRSDPAYEKSPSER